LRCHSNFINSSEKLKLPLFVVKKGGEVSPYKQNYGASTHKLLQQSRDGANCNTMKDNMEYHATVVQLPSQLDKKRSAHVYSSRQMVFRASQKFRNTSTGIHQSRAAQVMILCSKTIRYICIQLYLNFQSNH
jgi:hypothetical protein